MRRGDDGKGETYYSLRWMEIRFYRFIITYPSFACLKASTNDYQEFNSCFSYHKVYKLRIDALQSIHKLEIANTAHCWI